MQLASPTIVPLPGHPDHKPEDGNKSQKLERKITKIKAKRGESEDILINYNVFDERAKDGFFTSSFPCKEEATYQFYDALDALLPTLMGYLGLDSIWAEKGKVIGVSIKSTDDGLGITITGKCEINGYYACPTTPYFIAPEEHLINDLMRQAIAYLDGARKQQSLFDQNPVKES
jgi:hypothetical protein